MNAKEFRKQLAKISHDLDHGHLSQNESLLKLRELLESPSITQISDDEIADEIDKRYSKTSEIDADTIVDKVIKRESFYFGAKWLRDQLRPKETEEGEEPKTEIKEIIECIGKPNGYTPTEAIDQITALFLTQSTKK